MGLLHYNRPWVMLMKDIQTSLLSAFESSGLTYDELAKRTNLPKSALYRYINGDTEKIPIDRFQSICDELHVDAREILGWAGAPDPEDQPKNDDVRLLIRGLNKLSQEQLEQATSMMKIMFAKYADYFDKETDDHDTEL